MIVNFLIITLITNSLLLLWFFSPIKTTLSSILFKREMSVDEFDDMLFIKNKLLSKLLSCWICCSFWLSLFLGILWVIIFGYPFYWPILLFLTVPCLSYIFYTYIKG